MTANEMGHFIAQLECEWSEPASLLEAAGVV
jgi:hypothetical protein